MVIDLGEQPVPETEPAEPPPGGVDAVEESQFDEPPLVPDLPGLGNSPAKDDAPDELTEPDGTGDGPTSDGASEPTEETPA